MISVEQKGKLLSLLQQTRLFTQFKEELLLRLIEQSHEETYQQGRIILPEGSDNDCLFVLISGSVSIYLGTELMSGLSRKGDLFGELSTITRNLTAASVIAETSVEALVVPAGQMIKTDDFESKAMIYKITVDILTDKLKLTRSRVIGFQATSEELNEKKQKLAQSEDTIKQKDTILQSVLSSMSEGVVVTANDGTLLHINPAFRRMIGDLTIPPAIVNWPVNLGIFRKDRKTLCQPDDLPMIKGLSGVESEAAEFFIRNQMVPEGIWLQASSRFLKQEGSKAEGLVVVFHDITKKKEETIALLQAKKTAESMAQAKSNFLAIMSHELRTPLNSILGTTDLLSETELNLEQQDHLNSIKASSEILFTMICNILEYNNLESADFSVENKIFSLKSCFQEIKNSYNSAALKKKIGFIIEIDETLPEQVYGCERAITQILRNLVDNAIKFTTQGWVGLKAMPVKQNGKTAILFTVKDTGIGIAKSDLPHLFQPFAQVDSSYSRRFDGTGIGLSLSHKLVELIGSKLIVNSELDSGTEFSFSVDRDGPAGEQKTTMEKQYSKDPANLELNQEFASFYPMKILIAEDNVLNQKLMHKMLQKLGYDPDIVENGEEAFKAVCATHYRILLMDLQMPKMDGFAATRLIMQEVAVEQRPTIIALTAAVSSDIRQSCLDTGMKAFISKPIGMRKLAEILQEYY